MKTTKSTIQNEAAHQRGLVEAKRKKIAAQIDEIRSLNKSALQLRWQELFKKPVPDALTKDPLARMIAYRFTTTLLAASIARLRSCSKARRTANRSRNSVT